MRRGPHLTQAVGHSARGGHGLRTTLLPGIFVADHQDSALLAGERLLGATARRVLALRAHRREPHTRRLVVDRRGVAALHEARPALAGLIGLSEAEHEATARILD